MFIIIIIIYIKKRRKSKKINFFSLSRRTPHATHHTPHTTHPPFFFSFLFSSFFLFSFPPFFYVSPSSCSPAIVHPKSLLLFSFLPLLFDADRQTKPETAARVQIQICEAVTISCSFLFTLTDGHP